MPAEVEPPELARLIDFAERPRTHDWSLRSALCRFAQPEPERVQKVLELVRRIEWALRPHGKTIERSGQDIWEAMAAGAEGPSGSTEPDGQLVGLVRASAELDSLGDILAEWAVDRAVPRPNADVDRVIADVARRLDELGVPREDQARPPRGRG